MSQKVLVIIKPDGMARGLIGRVFDYVSQTQLKLIASKVVSVTAELIQKHYAHHLDKPFYQQMEDFWLGKFHNGSNQSLALVFEGEDAIKTVRTLAGNTNPEEADPRTLRGAYGRISSSGLYENVVHVSGNEEEARREIELWIGEENL